MVSAQPCGISIDVPSDVTLCAPNVVGINGNIIGDYLGFEWTGTNGYFNNSNLNVTDFPIATTTYKLSALGDPLMNLIFNGDFELGNVGFTSDYNHTFAGVSCPSGNQIYGLLGCEGFYEVGPNSALYHTNWNACTDHTTGGGDMLIVNGASSYQKIWCQDVVVNPNKNYVFKAYGTSMINESPAKLQFSINDVLIGSLFNLSGVPCQWEEFYAQWSSAGNTNITICVTNQNTALSGNDFALDDIYFGELCEVEDSFTVTISDYALTAQPNNDIDCLNPIANLESNVSPNGNYNYLWSTVNGSIIGSTETGTTEVNSVGVYTLEVTDDLGCSQHIDFYVAGSTEPPDLNILEPDTLTCYTNEIVLDAVSNETLIYQWVLPDGSVQSSSYFNTTLAGNYLLTAINEYGCISEDTIEVIENLTPPVIDMIVSGPITCMNQSIELSVSTSQPLTTYLWNGPSVDSTSSNQNSISVNLPGTYYIVGRIGERCEAIDSGVVIADEVFSLIKENAAILTCKNKETPLPLSIVGNFDTLSWYYNGDIISHAIQPIVGDTGTYIVEVLDKNFCLRKDSILVTGNFEHAKASIQIDTIDCIGNGGFSVNTDATKFLWEGPGGVFTDSVVSCKINGSYILAIEANNGCRDTILFDLPAIKNYPTTEIFGTTINCFGPGSLGTKTKEENSVTWSGPNGFSTNLRIFNVESSGKYFVNVQSPEGCLISDSITIQIDTIRPSIEIIGDTITCYKSEIVLQAISSDSVLFEWLGPNNFSSGQQNTIINKGGMYFLNAQSKNGCIAKDIIYIEEKTKSPELSINYQDINCNHPQTYLVPQSNELLKFQLIFGNQAQTFVDSFLIVQEGKYTITATNKYGCDTSTVFDVKSYLNPPEVKLVEGKLTCNHPSIILKNLLHNDDKVQYLWDSGSGFVEMDSIVVINKGLYILKATNENGCISEAQAQIEEEKNLPKISVIGSDTLYCKRTTIALKANTDVFNGEITWKAPDGRIGKELGFLADKAGNYTVHLINLDNGCRDSSSKYILSFTPPDLIAMNVLQPGCTHNFGAINDFTIKGGLPPILYYLNKTQVPDLNLSTLIPGEYFVTLEDALGCTIDTFFNIKEVDDLEVTLTPTIFEVEKNEEFEFLVKSNFDDSRLSKINWIPSSGLSCADCLNPTVNVSEDIHYKVFVFSNDGCIDSADVSIRIKKYKGFYIPNIIKGNNQTNGHFTIFSRDNSILEIESLQIFDRWGNKVFEADNFLPDLPSLGWNGTFNASECMPGVYVYLATIRYIDGTKEIITGDVTLIR